MRERGEFSHANPQADGVSTARGNWRAARMTELADRKMEKVVKRVYSAEVRLKVLDASKGCDVIKWESSSKLDVGRQAMKD